MVELFLQFLAQLGGGPGPAENNLVRFALPAFFWAILFVVAWSRQRNDPRPRERLLLFGFGLALSRDLFMFLHTAGRFIAGPASVAHASYSEPFEHALTALAILVISAAFMRFVLDEEAAPRRYLLAGSAVVALGLIISYATWPALRSNNPHLNFRSTIGGWTMQLTVVVFITAAIVILLRAKGWVRNVVVAALALLLGSVLLTLANTVTDRVYDHILCPLGNNLYIWAVPLLGFVYFREQSLAKREAEASLSVYRTHLEQLVDQRTADLAVSKQEAEQWARGLSHLHEVSLRLNKTLEQDEISRLIVVQAARLLDCDMACLFRLDRDMATAVGVADCGKSGAGIVGMKLSVGQFAVLEDLVAGGKPLIIDDYRSNPLLSSLAWQHDPIRSLVGVRVGRSGEVKGLLFACESSAERTWQSYEIRLLESFAERAAVAWENAFLHRQVQKTVALEERQRIAADMHDGLAQSISVLALRNDQVAEMVEEKQLRLALGELAKMQDIISAAGRDLRRSIASLCEDPQPRCTLQEALYAVAQGEYEGSCPRIAFENDVVAPVQLPHEQFDQVVHIAQEALLNACRHAGAGLVTLRLSANGISYELLIEDDGRGFRTDELPDLTGDHFGLTIMEARAQRVGGELAIATNPGAGTKVTLRWPKHADQGNKRRDVAESFFASVIDEEGVNQ